MAIINPMNNDSPTNPYHLDGDVSVAPFAGRQDAFGRLYGLTSDPGRQHAFLFLGRQGVGKTALLHALAALHNETAICPIIPLRDMEITHEAAWLLDLAQSVTAVLIERGFTLSRLSMIEAPGADMRLWLDTVFLPHIFATIRPTRQLIFLFDDADRLLLEIKTGTLPADLLDFFVELLKKYRQLQFVFTLDTEFEDQISEFGALVSYQHMLRLGNLPMPDVKWLLTTPASGYYVVPDEVVGAAYRQTGGEPTLTQRFGYEFFRRWYDAPDLNVITLDDVRKIAARLYAELRGSLRNVWDRLGVNERLALTAISGTLYDDPLTPLTPAALQAWLVETDYPLDTTAINAALRGLEYRELITANPITITSEMMKTWLLDNARTINRAALPKPERPPAITRAAINPRVIRLLLLALAVLIIANVIAAVLVNNNRTIVVTGTPAPTVTLAQPGQ